MSDSKSHATQVETGKWRVLSRLLYPACRMTAGWSLNGSVEIEYGLNGESMGRKLKASFEVVSKKQLALEMGLVGKVSTKIMVEMIDRVKPASVPLRAWLMDSLDTDCKRIGALFY